MKKLFTFLILLLIAVSMASTAYATTCAEAVPIPGAPTFPYVSSLTCGTTNDISSTNATVCGSGSYLGGFEAVYVWTPTNSYIDVSFAYAGVTWSGLFLYQDCPTSGGTCIGNVTGSGASKTLAYIGTNMTSGTKISVSSGVTYYLVIDTWPTPNSPCPGTITINGTQNLACSGTPAPGNTLASTNPACAGVNFTLSLENLTPGSGVTYQWESSTTGGAPWTSIGTTPTLSVSQIATTYYRCQVTCSGNTGTSTPLQVTMNPYDLCYCTSMASNTADEEIYSVTVNGTTNAYDCATVAPGPGSLLNRYSNFKTLGSLFSLPQGSASSFTVEENECDGATYYSNGCAIWIDFNSDGDFTDADEMVYSESATTLGPRTISGSLFVPATAALGDVYMRVTVAEGYFGATLTPCLAYAYGETEDYKVTIIPPVSCPGPINLTATPSAFDAVIGWTEVGTATNWDIEYGVAPYTFTGTPTISGVTNPYTLLSLIPSTGYSYKVRSNCSVKSASTWSGPLNFTTLVACPAPTALSVSGILQTSAKLGWTEMGSAAAWDIELGVNGFTPTGIPTVAGVTDNPYLYGGLTSATSYSFYVRAVCGGINGNSTWVGPYTFSTSCGVLSLPYCQYFPTAAFPDCWTEQLSGLITTNHWSTVNSAIAGGTPYEARAYYGPGQGATQADNDRMVSPGLNTTGLSSIHLSFQQMLNDYDAGVNDVWIKVQSSADGTTWTDEWVYNGGLGVSIPAELKEIDITNNLGGTTYIAFTLAGYTYDINYWYVDNVCVSVPLPLDATTVSIDNVPSLATPGTVITPQATVKNIGTTSPVTFDVTMTATGGYISTVTGVTLAAGTSTQVTFADWTPALGDFTAQVCTQLTGDQDPTNDCKSKAVSIQVLKKVYAYVAYDPTASLPEGPAYFYTQSPGTIVSLGATTSDQFIGAGCWANDVWYGSEYYDGTVTPNGGGWWTIDPVSGAMNKKADFDIGFAGLAFNKNTNTMYGTEWTGSTNNLYTIDPLTGVATLLGSFGTDLMINLACDGTDLFAIGLTNDELYKIFPTTPPTAIIIGPTGLAFNYAQDMEFDYDNNIMYAAGYTSVGALYNVSRTSGTCTLIGNFQGGSEITGFAIPYTSVATKTLTVKVLLEGLYNGTGGLRKAQNETGDQFTGTTADQVNIELHNSSDGALVESFNNVDLTTSGIVTVNPTNSGSYYIYVIHRNSITTSSATPVSFAGSTINYDFSTDVSQAFGSNMKDVGGVAVVFAGDVDRSCGIDSGDMIPVDNDNTTFAVGYIVTDVDGSGGIDSGDMIIVDNNNAGFVGCVLPF